MKITFYRKGYANNSSSSHSLIFTGDKGLSSSNANGEYGWNYFTCADKRSKINYMLITLFNNFSRYSPESKGYITWEDIKELTALAFIKFVRTNFPILEKELAIGNWREGYVDHQSLIGLPIYRNKDEWNQKIINVEFCNALINEIVNKDYAILGGNDNGGDSHPDKNCHIANEDTDEMIRFLYGITDQYHCPLCERDNKTGEFVLSKFSGDIMKVKFNE